MNVIFAGTEKTVDTYTKPNAEYEIRSQLDVITDDIRIPKEWEKVVAAVAVISWFIAIVLGGIFGFGVMLNNNPLSIPSWQLFVGTVIYFIVDTILILRSPPNFGCRDSITVEQTMNRLYVRLYTRTRNEPYTRVAEKDYRFKLNNQSEGTKYMNHGVLELEKQINLIESKRVEPANHDRFHDQLLAGMHKTRSMPTLQIAEPTKRSDDRFSNIEIADNNDD